MVRTGGRWRRSRRYSPRSRRARMATRLDLTNAGLPPVPAADESAPKVPGVPKVERAFAGAMDHPRGAYASFVALPPQKRS